MRRWLASMLVAFAWPLPVLAQEAPPAEPATPPAAEDQNAPSTDAAQRIQQGLQSVLAGAGFTNIQMVPNSFLITAKNRDGREVVLIATPNSITELDESAADNQDSGKKPQPEPAKPPAVQGPVEKM
jgi:hypothetical protein